MLRNQCIYTVIIIDLAMLCNHLDSQFHSNKIIITASYITAVGGEDFDAITDHRLTFGPGATSLRVPINITSDGNFEETENFSVTLTVRDFRLQLSTGTAFNLRQHVCMDRGIFAISSNDTQNNEAVRIDLNRIFVSQLGDSVSFKLAANESERVGVNPARTSVTIFDNDSMFSIVQSVHVMYDIAVCLKGNNVYLMKLSFFSPL